MVIPNAVTYGVLASIGLLVLVAFVVVFMRPERALKRIEEDRPPTPLGWPISPAAAAPSPVRPVMPRAASSRPKRLLNSAVHESREGVCT
jgi:hypothetical protein